ncbi:MAG: hypothetical protein LUE64_02860 [Candidatus Gastranaerophilales bacterium]|nr:hypothetical protein [Candidatus Gastranaerophilales bacterium]
MTKITKKYDNLAQFVFHTREKLGLSVSGLSKKCNLNEEIITNIEAGLELFLPSTIRQKLAKGLRVSLNEIKMYEKGEDYNFVSPQILEELRLDILYNSENKAYTAFCPICGSKLITRIAKLYDLEDNLVLHPKARCSKCPFQLHS